MGDLKNKPMAIRAELVEGVARIIDPAAFAEPGPQQVTQRNVLGKPVAYDRMSDADLERDRRLALETAGEIVPLVDAWQDEELRQALDKLPRYDPGVKRGVIWRGP